MRDDDDEVRETPGTVVGATAAGTVPLPFLGVYAVMFIVHGGIHPVTPPDITSTPRGELWAGIVALIFFVVSFVALIWMFNGRWRIPFALVQAGTLAIAIDFIVDATKGGRLISGIVAVASAIAIVLAFLPPSSAYLGRTRRRRRIRRRLRRERDQLPAGSAPVADTTPTAPRYVGRPSPRRNTESV